MISLLRMRGTIEVLEVWMLAHGIGLPHFGTDRVHVIGIGQPKKEIKTMARWHVFRRIAQMPFANATGRVTFCFQVLWRS